MPVKLCGSGLFFPLPFVAHHPYAIHMDGQKRHKLRGQPVVDSEKLTINLGFVDLGHIDLLVRQGFYSNRSDFIRAAIRKEISAHSDAANRAIIRSALELGLRHFTRAELERVKASGTKLNVRVLGLASIADDVSPALARATIESIKVLGAFHASDEIKQALADRLVQ